MNETPASTRGSSPDAPDVCRRRWRDTTPDRSVYSRRRRGTIPTSDPVLPRPRVADDFSRPLPAPPIDEAGWGVPVAVGTRALGRARGVDARTFEAGRALGTPTRPLTPSVRSPTTPSPGAPSQWRARRLRTKRGSGQRCPQRCSLHRASASKNQSARWPDPRPIGKSIRFSPTGAHTVFDMLTHHAGIFSTDEWR